MSAPAIQFDDGDTYELGMGVYSRIIGAVFLKWLDAPKGLRWIDVGCGNGAFTELLLQHASPVDVAAIDPSRGQLDFARRRMAKGATFHQGDAMTLPFDNANFDAAVMALVLFFVPQPERGIAEMVRVTRPGGLVSAYVWDVPNGGLPVEPIFQALREVGVETASPPSATVSAMPALRAAFTDVGLHGLETRSIVVERRFADFDAYWQAGLMIGSLNERMATLSANTLDEVRSRTRVHLPIAPNGTTIATGTANAIKGIVSA